MADFTLGPRNDVFPVGTSVGAYPATAFAGAPDLTSPPPDSEVVDTQTMTATGLVFTGLTAGVPYYAIGQVGSAYPFMSFAADADADPVESVVIDEMEGASDDAKIEAA